MKKVIYAFIFLPLFSSGQHVSKVYYNIVNESRDWFSEPVNVDYDIEINEYEDYVEVVTANFENSFFILTDTIYSSTQFTKWKSIDWKGDDCVVSIGHDLDENQYIIIQYPDMGWCLFFNKN
jgi:hypothetical protein